MISTQEITDDLRREIPEQPTAGDLLARSAHRDEPVGQDPIGLEPSRVVQRQHHRLRVFARPGLAQGVGHARLVAGGKQQTAMSPEPDRHL